MAGPPTPTPEIVIPPGDWIADYLAYASHNREIPAIYNEWVAVSTIAATLQRKVRLPWGSLEFFPNFYNILVGASGVRKSTGMDLGKRMLVEVGVDLVANVTTKEALIDRLEQAAETFPDLESETIHQTSSLSAFASELTVLLRREKQELIDILTEWYDCGPRFSYDTKLSGKPVIPGPWFNLLGCTTPTVVQHSLNPTIVGGGFTSRVIFVFSDYVGDPESFPFPTSDQERLRDNLVRRLDTFLSLRGDMEPSEELFYTWDLWYKDARLNPRFSHTPNLAGYENRRPTHVLKLAMIFSASEGSFPVITRNGFLRASDLLSRTEVQMPRVFGSFGIAQNSELLSRVVEILHVHGGMVSQRQMFSALQGDIASLQAFNEVIEVLKVGGQVKETIKGSNSIYSLTEVSNGQTH